MHEYSIACEIFEQVLATAQAHEASEVRSVTLEIGRFTHVNPDQLSFCFGVLAEDSIAEGAKLEFRIENPFLECECGYKGKLNKAVKEKKEELKEGLEEGLNKGFEDRLKEGFEKEFKEGLLSDLLEYATTFKCPACGKQAKITGGRELIIKSIDIEK